MKRFEHTIHEPTGIHAGTAHRIAKIARQFPDTVVTIACAGRTVRADGLLRLITMGIRCGERVTVTCDGSGEMDAIVVMQNYFWNHL